MKMSVGENRRKIQNGIILGVVSLYVILCDLRLTNNDQSSLLVQHQGSSARAKVLTF